MRRQFGSIKTQSKKGNSYYEASHASPDMSAGTKRVYKTFPHTREGYRQAESWLDDEQIKIKAGAWHTPHYVKSHSKASHIIFADYARQWVENRRKPNGDPLKESTKLKHWEIITNHLLPYFGTKELHNISEQDIQKWWDLQPVTTNGHGGVIRHKAYTLMKAIMATAARTTIDGEGTPLISHNPCLIRSRRPKSPHQAVIAEISDLKHLYQAMPDRLALSVLLAGICGLRKGEVCALQRQDINLNNNTITIRHSIMATYPNNHQQLTLTTPKTSSSIRTITYPTSLTPLIVNHLTTYTKPQADALLFTSQKGNYLAPQTLTNMWNKAKNKAGLTSMWFHDLRKTALTRMVEAGATVGEVMAQAGHTSISVASIYQKQSHSHQQQVLTNLNTLLTTTGLTDPTKNNPPQRSQASDNLIDYLRGLPDQEKNAILSSLEPEKRVEIMGKLLS